MGLLDNIKGALGLKDDASEDDVAKALAEKITQKAKDDNGGTAPAGTPGTDALTRALQDLGKQNENIQLAELNRTIQELRQQNTQLQDSQNLAEAHRAVQSLSTEGRGWVLPVPEQEQLLKILLAAPKNLRDDVVMLFQGIKEKGLVQLTELGRTTDQVDLAAGDDPVKAFTTGIDRRIAESQGKMTYGEAVRALTEEKPELYAAYRRAVDLNRVGDR